MQVTAEQVQNLWHEGGRIDRGDNLSPVTQDDLSALVDAVDTDDQGNPLDTEWEILANQLNSNEDGEPTSGEQERMLGAVADAASAIRDAEIERDDLIRQAIAEGVPVVAVAEAASLSRARIYQIRDGRR